MVGNAYTSTGFSPDDGWTHINNFNYGNSNFNPEEAQDKGFREIKYIHSSGTEDFACRSSMASQDSWIHDWVLVHLTWEEDGITRDGYYLGFDFSGSTQETEIARDGFYSNWIIKISPALFAPNQGKTARVMCEDLGGSFDFDFNDVVFDVAHDANNHQVVICLQASGGTLPIYVGNDSKYEAHYMLGQSKTDIPVNVDANPGAKHEVAIYRISDSEYLTNSQLDVKKIPVYVKHKGSDSYTSTTSSTEIGDQAWTQDQYGHQYDAAASKVPRKFATEVGVNWMQELKFINDGYQKFIEWVKNPNYTYEVTITDTNTKQTLHWFDDRAHFELIYQGPEAPKATGTSNVVVSWNSLKTLHVDNSFKLKNSAVDYITIRTYGDNGGTNVNSIKNQLDSKNLTDPVTFAYITKTAAVSDKIPGSANPYVHGVIFPIWIIGTGDNATPYWVKPDGTRVEITEAILKAEASYRPATWQSSFVRSGVNGATVPETDYGQGIDADGNYTFVTKYGYTKSDLYIDINNDGNREYCDYVAFYVYEDVDSNPYSTAAWNDDQGTMNNAGDVKKYECYVIF